MKNFILLSLLLTLSSCNIYEVAGVETESILLKYSRVKASPSKFENGTFSTTEFIRLKIVEGDFNSGMVSTDINVYDDCGHGFYINNFVRVGPSEVTFDLVDPAPPVYNCEITLELQSAGFTPYNQTDQTTAGTKIILEP